MADQTRAMLLGWLLLVAILIGLALVLGIVLIDSGGRNVGP
ncbi:MAG TPA: hypothetical protein VF198_18705 [Vicinamibacterales bacterium]